ncbi:MAG: hypothetical protein IPJ55_07550 [Chloracidobacterium sp.]|nr:hypothetical protein [Chloracidobacterium sp.]
MDELLSNAEESQSPRDQCSGRFGREAIRDEIEFIAGATLLAKPNGANIHILDENDIGAGYSPSPAKTADA